MVIMSFSGCAKITCPLRWLLLLGGSECSLPKKLFYYPQPRADGSQRSSERKEVKKTGKKKFYKDVKNIYLSAYTHALRGRACVFEIWMMEILKCRACWRLGSREGSGFGVSCTLKGTCCATRWS